MVTTAWIEGDLRVIKCTSDFGTSYSPQYRVQGQRWCYFLDNRGDAREFPSFLPAMLLAKQGYEDKTHNLNDDNTDALLIKRTFTSIAPDVMH